MKITILFLLLFICNICYCQNGNMVLKGCWAEVYTGSVYEKKDGYMQKTSYGVRGNEIRMMLLLSENKGLYFLPGHNNCISGDDEFLWSADSCKYIFKESEECPYTEDAFYTIRSSEECDTLYLEYRYKNPNYITRNMYLRKRISLESGSVYSKGLSRNDKYIAFNNRIIKDQRPLVYEGNYNNGVLTINRSVFKYLQKMTKADQVEIHIVHSTPSECVRRYIFIVTYDPASMQIENISYIDDYLD